MTELRAGDIAPGTVFEVTVLDSGKFYAVMFYNWPSKLYAGVGQGATFTEAAGRAIAEAEGVEYEPPSASPLPDTPAETLADQHRTGDIR
jgi:hypothetical protein